MLYLREFAGWGYEGNPTLLGLTRDWDDWLGWKQETWDKANAPFFGSGAGRIVNSDKIAADFPRNRWTHIKIVDDGTRPTKRAVLRNISCWRSGQYRNRHCTNWNERHNELRSDTPPEYRFHPGWYSRNEPKQQPDKHGEYCAFERSSQECVDHQRPFLSVPSSRATRSRSPSQPWVGSSGRTTAGQAGAVIEEHQRVVLRRAQHGAYQHWPVALARQA